MVFVADTVTSEVPFKDPVPTVVSPTFNVTAPAVLENPPNLALKAFIVWLLGNVVVKVMLVTGLEDAPTWLYDAFCVKDFSLLVTVVIVQVFPWLSSPVSVYVTVPVPEELLPSIFVLPEALPKLIVPTTSPAHTLELPAIRANSKSIVLSKFFCFIKIVVLKVNKNIVSYLLHPIGEVLADLIIYKRLAVDPSWN